MFMLILCDFCSFICCLYNIK